MKKLTLFTGLLAVTVFLQAQKADKLWETSADLTVCESVLAGDNVLYVSCINGKPDQQGSLGFIAQLTPDGKITKLKWAEGLNAPKGMGIWKNTLYVTDVHQVVLINLADGKITKKIPVPGSKFLNDIAVAKNGTVAVSDMNDNTIYSVKGEKLDIICRDASLDHVNGLYFDAEGQLYAGTQKGILKVNQAQKTAELYIMHEGGIDGLEQVSPGKFLASDWQGHVYFLQEGQPEAVILDLTADKRNAADIGYDAKKGIIYIPTFFANTTMAFKLTIP
jgi:hypothetical protein